MRHSDSSGESNAGVEFKQSTLSSSYIFYSSGRELVASFMKTWNSDLDFGKWSVGPRSLLLQNVPVHGVVLLHLLALRSEGL